MEQLQSRHKNTPPAIACKRRKMGDYPGAANQIRTGDLVLTKVAKRV